MYKCLCFIIHVSQNCSYVPTPVRDLSVFDLHCILRKSSPFKVKHASNVSTATGNLTYTALLTKPGSYSNSASANAVLKKIKENSSKSFEFFHYF